MLLFLLGTCTAILLFWDSVVIVIIFFFFDTLLISFLLILGFDSYVVQHLNVVLNLSACTVVVRIMFSSRKCFNNDFKRR